MPPGYFLSIGAARLLIDPGPGSVSRGASFALDPLSASAVVLTHNHLDHSADILPFLFSRKYCQRGAGAADIRIFSPIGFSAEFGKLMEVYGRHIISPEYRIIIEEMGSGQWEGPAFSIRSAPLFHSGNAVGYRFTKTGGPALVYSGDTGYCEEIISLARGADTLVIECTYPDGALVDGHLTPSDVGSIASQSGVKQVVITHMKPEVDKDEAVKSIRREGYGGVVIVAEDGMRISV
jgi:ribonuclease BN (tRNA processing enzyme)